MAWLPCHVMPLTLAVSLLLLAFVGSAGTMLSALSGPPFFLAEASDVMSLTVTSVCFAGTMPSALSGRLMDTVMITSSCTWSGQHRVRSGHKQQLGSAAAAAAAAAMAA